LDGRNKGINFWTYDIEKYDSDNSYISHEHVVFNAVYEEEEKKDEEDIQNIHGFNFKDLLSKIINKLQQQCN